MKNRTKICLLATIGVLGVIGVNNRVGATLRVSMVNLFNSISGRVLRGGNIISNLKGNSRLLSQVRGLVGENLISGRNSTNFTEEASPDKIKVNQYYYQIRTGDGKLRTLTSTKKPKVLYIDGAKVLVEYKDLAGEKQILATEGAPQWLKGSDIKFSSKLFLLDKMDKYFQSTAGEEMENYYGIDAVETTQGHR